MDEIMSLYYLDDYRSRLDGEYKQKADELIKRLLEEENRRRGRKTENWLRDEEICCLRCGKVIVYNGRLIHCDVSGGYYVCNYCNGRTAMKLPKKSARAKWKDFKPAKGPVMVAELKEFFEKASERLGLFRVIETSDTDDMEVEEFV